MKKALISPNELVSNGYRVAEVREADNIFPVADPLYWMDCDDEVVADQYWFDPTDNTIKAIPRRAPKIIGNAPNVIT